MRHPWPYTFNKTNTPAELWQSTANVQSQPIGVQQAIPLPTHTPPELQQLSRYPRRLDSEVDGLRNDDSNIKNVSGNLKNRQPDYTYQYYKVEVQNPSNQLPLTSYPYLYKGYGDNVKRLSYVPTNLANSTEQFEVRNTSQRSARTFTFISDLFTSLFPTCVDPCTISAYNQNRCCVNLVTVPSSSACCPYAPAIPQPQPIIPPRPVLVGPPPIRCCNACGNFFYGPPPCTYYGGAGGGYYGNGGGSVVGGGPGLYLGGGLGNLAYGGLGISLRSLG